MQAESVDENKNIDANNASHASQQDRVTDMNHSNQEDAPSPARSNKSRKS